MSGLSKRCKELNHEVTRTMNGGRACYTCRCIRQDNRERRVERRKIIDLLLELGEKLAASKIAKKWRMKTSLTTGFDNSPAIVPSS